MSQKKNLIGQRFGRLTIIGDTGKRCHQGNVIWLCRCDCGTEKEIKSNNLTSGNTRSCGCLRREARFNGKERIKHKGYIRLWCPFHPRAHQGRVFEHVFVAERMLGRPLENGEVVHHINGNLADNRPENLMIFPSHNEHVKFHNKKLRNRDPETGRFLPKNTMETR